MRRLAPRYRSLAALAALRATYAEVPSGIGHRALGPAAESAEAGFIDRALRNFLGTRN